MTIKLKRRLTYGTILFFNLCTGLGYAIIFPTIWNYVQRLGGQANSLGIIISAYSLSSFFANPLVGWWSDKSLDTRTILLVTVLAEMIGSLMYFVGVHIWMLIIGRLIAGIGAGGGSAVLADITRTTSEDERTPVLSVVIASRQIGLIIGPVFNIFLSKLDFHVFNLPVDKYTSPGLFMALLWLLLEIIVIFAYYNLTALQDEEDVEKLFQNYSGVRGSLPYSDLDNLSSLEVAFTSSYPPYSSNFSSTLDSVAPGALAYSSSQPNLQVEWLEGDGDHISSLKKEEIETIKCQQITEDFSSVFQNNKKSPVRKIRNAENRAASVSDRMIESAERMIQSTSGSYGKYLDDNSGRERQDTSNSRVSSAIPSTPYSSEPVSLPDERTGLLSHIRQDYFRDEIIVLLSLAFISSFAQTALETVVTPLAQKYYNFGEMENSYIYLCAGVEAILVFACIKYASRKFSDRSLIVCGLLFSIVSMILPILFIPSAIPGDNKTLVYFIFTIIINLIGIALIVVCSSSLLSKLTSEDSQALFQGFRRSMVSLGCIMGPLWGGAFLFNIYLLFSIPLAVTGMIIILFVLSYNKLNVERV